MTLMYPHLDESGPDEACTGLHLPHQCTPSKQIAGGLGRVPPLASDSRGAPMSLLCETLKPPVCNHSSWPGDLLWGLAQDIRSSTEPRPSLAGGSY